MVKAPSAQDYIPQMGDIVYINKESSEYPVGHEQNLPRPGLVVSDNDFNRVKKLAWVCPITNTNRNDPTHIQIDDSSLKTTGVIMVDQMRAFDWRARNFRFIEKCPDDYLCQALFIMRKIAPPKPEWKSKSS